MSVENVEAVRRSFDARSRGDIDKIVRMMQCQDRAEALDAVKLTESG